MKRCPQCRAEYFDEMLEFCLEDGTQLFAVSHISDDAATVTRANKSTPLPEKTLNLSGNDSEKTIFGVGADERQAKGIRQQSLEKASSAAAGVLEVLPIILALAHNWWQWLYVSNQTYSSVSTFLLSFNFWVWMFLLVTGVSFGLLAVKRSLNKNFGFAGLIILAVNLILFLVPKR